LQRLAFDALAALDLELQRRGHPRRGLVEHDAELAGYARVEGGDDVIERGWIDDRALDLQHVVRTTHDPIAEAAAAAGTGTHGHFHDVAQAVADAAQGAVADDGRNTGLAARTVLERDDLVGLGINQLDDGSIHAYVVHALVFVPVAGAPARAPNVEEPRPIGGFDLATHFGQPRARLAAGDDDLDAEAGHALPDELRGRLDQMLRVGRRAEQRPRLEA